MPASAVDAAVAAVRALEEAAWNTVGAPPAALSARLAPGVTADGMWWDGRVLAGRDSVVAAYAQ